MKKEKNKVVVPQKKVGFKTYMKKYWQLYVMLLFPLLYLAIFKYTPMSYIQIAFKKYKINRSLWEMPWADNFGFEYFIDAFSNPDFFAMKIRGYHSLFFNHIKFSNQENRLTADGLEN